MIPELLDNIGALAPEILFYILAGTAVVLAMAVVSARNPIYSALALILYLFTIAGIFALSSAHLIALLQVLIYAGAIMVLILFVVMILNLSPEELGMAKFTFTKVMGTALLGILATVLVGTLAISSPDLPATDALFGTLEGVGMLLFTKYLLPFELVSLLLLAAIVGAVLLTRKAKGSGS